MRNTKSKIIIVMIIMICLMVTGYAAFSTSLTITGTSNITSEWNVVFTDITEVSKTSGVTIVSSPTASGTSATFDVGLSVPGDKIIYQITIENKGTIDAIIQNIQATATDSPAIIFSISDINIGDTIANKATKTFTVTIEYNPATTSQPDKTNKELTVNITMVQSTGQSITPSTPSIDQPLYLSSAIFRDNIAYADTDIDFSAISSDTNGKGLYYTSTNTEGNLTTYYFRGAVENNYVKMGTYTKNMCIYEGVDTSYVDLNMFDFIYDTTEEQCTSTTVCAIEGLGNVVGFGEGCADMGGVDTGKYATYTANVTKDMLWRIVRINEDGSIRMVTQDIIGGSAFNTNYNDNAYVGYMYGTTGSSTHIATHTNTTDSTIKDYLDSWYEYHLKTNYGSYLADTGFCNDRSVASTANTWNLSDTALGYAKNVTYYGAYNRLVTNKKPQFACPNESRDLFTTSTSTKGNKALTYPIGLLTADEVAYAGGLYNTINESMYLTNGGVFWAMSPFDFYGSNAVEWYVYGDGLADSVYVYFGFGVRPVVNLKSTVEIIVGDGKLNTPYIIG